MEEKTKEKEEEKKIEKEGGRKERRKMEMEERGEDGIVKIRMIEGQQKT